MATRVMLGYLHPGWVHHAFMESVLKVRTSEDLPWADVELVVASKRSSADISRGRNAIARVALEEEVDYLWWVDTDMVFGPQHLLRLMKPEYGILSALCYTQDEDGTQRPVGSMFDQDTRLRRITDDDVASADGGLLEVAGIGMACCVISRTALQRTFRSDEMPYRDRTVNGVPVEPDISFCLLQYAMDYEDSGVWMDTSLVAGHVKDRVIWGP